MKLPKISIDNYQFTIVVFALLLLVGVTSFLTMPRTEDPPMQLPGASVIIIYPGANPNDLEELIATPIEEALNELDDIKRLETGIRDGIVATAVEFTFDTDADEKFNEVVQQVNSIRNKLPDDIYGLEVLEWSSTDVVMMQLALVSETAEYSSLEEAADQLKKEIEKVGGVKQVEILALPGQEVRVSLDIEKMARMNISLERVSQSILSNNANIPGGSIEAGTRNFNIKTSGTYNNLDEIRNTVVSSYNGRLIYLENIADVQFDYEDNVYLARYNGERCIFLTVKQKTGFNIFKIADGLHQVLEDYQSTLHPSTELIRVFDQSESVDQRINGFMSNLLQGIFLVGLIIVLSLGLRASIIVIIAIPFSILIGLGFVDMSGFGLQQISIAGLVISLGLLVDNSIVIVENIERFIGLGHTRRDASIKGGAQLGWPIITATATTMLAFIPIITMPDKAGRFIQSLPVTVLFTMFASLILALTLTPYLASVFLKAGDAVRKRKYQFNLKTPLKKLIEGPYRRILDFSLRRTWLIILLSVLGFIGSVALFQVVGVSFFPKAEKPQFMIRIDAPESASLDKADEIAMYVESVLDTLPGIRHYATNVGHGNPRIYYNIFPKRNEKSFAEIFVELEEYEVQHFDSLIVSLRELFSGYPGARINIKEFEQGAPIEAPLTVKILGDNLDELKKISNDLEQFVRQTPGVVNVENQLSKTNTDLYFNINKDKASMLGVPVYEIDRTIRTCITGMTISKFRDSEGKEYGIVLRMPFDDRVKIEDFDRIYVTSLTGRSIPLNQLASIELKKAPGLITHFDMDRNGTITGDIAKGYDLDEIIAELRVHFEDYPWPEDYSYKFTGELESREESFGGIMRASLIALIAIFAVLVLQFRSFSQPLIIFSAIPLAVIGSVLALYFTGNSFSFTAGIGFISLIGVVV
ncbi:MAG: efflux RND transporter permease subunit, partial [Bacteroidales bacterium]|nr:efflux RND transporter permease subunit [Bacteroidales bacterium]